ncbi:hypothetical protein AKJ16_DCAP17549 [Drosera capensis]
MAHSSTFTSTNCLSSQELQSLRGLLPRSVHITTCWKKHGATYHITQSIIPSMTETPHQFITVANENTAHVLGSEPLSLTPSLTLPYVLSDLRTQAVIGGCRELRDFII